MHAVIVFVFERRWLPRVRVGGVDDESKTDEKVALVPLTEVEEGGGIDRIQLERCVEEGLEGFHWNAAAIRAGKNWIGETCETRVVSSTIGCEDR